MFLLPTKELMDSRPTKVEKGVKRTYFSEYAFNTHMTLAYEFLPGSCLGWGRVGMVCWSLLTSWGRTPTCALIASSCFVHYILDLFVFPSARMMKSIVYESRVAFHRPRVSVSPPPPPPHTHTLLGIPA